MQLDSAVGIYDGGGGRGRRTDGGYDNQILPDTVEGGEEGERARTSVYN